VSTTVRSGGGGDADVAGVDSALGEGLAERMDGVAVKPAEIRGSRKVEQASGWSPAGETKPVVPHSAY
jgi:hypothetical protein